MCLYMFVSAIRVKQLNESRVPNHHTSAENEPTLATRVKKREECPPQNCRRRNIRKGTKKKRLRRKWPNSLHAWGEEKVPPKFACGAKSPPQKGPETKKKPAAKRVLLTSNCVLRKAATAARVAHAYIWLISRQMLRWRIIRATSRGSPEK